MSMFVRVVVAIVLASSLTTGCALQEDASLLKSPALLTPAAKSFTGKTGGCGDFLIYRFDDSQTLAITVSVREDQLDWSTPPVTIEIEANTASATVEVLQFREPPESYFCDDVGGDPKPIAKWQAVAGKIVIERAMEPPPPEVRNATHQISVKLRSISLRNAKTGETATIEELDIKQVQVGWYAG